MPRAGSQHSFYMGGPRSEQRHVRAVASGLLGLGCRFLRLDASRPNNRFNRRVTFAMEGTSSQEDASICDGVERPHAFQPILCQEPVVPSCARDPPGWIG